MRPTRWSVLVVSALVAGGVAYVVTRAEYDSLPAPTGFLLLWIALLAIAEFYLALSTRARLAGRSGTRRVDPLVVARFVALAKASAIVGSLAVGGYSGFLIWVSRLDSAAAHHDTRTAAFGVALSVLLVAAALLLEYVCRVPKREDDDDERPSTRVG
jgi:uncharacterized membrane protein YbhN (UPF0104 family)